MIFFSKTKKNFFAFFLTKAQRSQRHGGRVREENFKLRQFVGINSRGGAGEEFGNELFGSESRRGAARAEARGKRKEEII